MLRTLGTYTALLGAMLLTACGGSPSSQGAGTTTTSTQEQSAASGGSTTATSDAGGAATATNEATADAGVAGDGSRDPAQVLAALEPAVQNIHDVAPWSVPGQPGLVFGRGSREGTSDVLVWGREGGPHGTASLCCAEVRAVVPLDLDGDGAEEIVALMAAEPGSHEPSVHAYKFHDDQVSAMQRLAWLLDGTTDEAALRARAATLRGWPADPAPASARELVLRLMTATPEQARALVGPAGLRTCTSNRGNVRPHTHRCQTYRGAALTDQVLQQHVIRASDFHELEDQESENGPGLNAPECTRRGATETCDANEGGPAGYEWVFQGAGPARHLVEVGSWATETE